MPKLNSEGVDSIVLVFFFSFRCSEWRRSSLCAGCRTWGEQSLACMISMTTSNLSVPFLHTHCYRDILIITYKKYRGERFVFEQNQ